MLKFTNLIQESSSSKFKLGLDIHGVLNALPEFFAFLTDSIIKNGGEVHLITGGTWSKELENEVKRYNIKYTHVFSVYDYLIESNAKQVGSISFGDGTIQRKFEDEQWDRVKGDYCLKNDINLHIDDTLIYNDYFKTPFSRLWTHNNKPKESHKSIRHLDK
jgi:hypothetical protein